VAPFHPWHRSTVQGDPTTCPFDAHATVYSSFDPANPLQNCIAVNDDGGVGACPLLDFQVPSGETYTIVVTSYANGTTGDWQANFTGTVPVELTGFAVE
jgi:hypothetical protein